MKTEAEINWETLRATIAGDAARERAHSKKFGDEAYYKAVAFERVLDAMHVMEHGLDDWRARHEADASWVPGLAERAITPPGESDEFKDCSCGDRIYRAANGNWYHWALSGPTPACIPGLAEHTQAAPNLEGVAPLDYNPSVPGLDAHTQAACDTIKAASE